MENPGQPAGTGPDHRRVIGLLGGVASGKSTVARLMERHGLLRLDADEEARRVVEEPAVRAAIAARFGDDVVGDAGRVDRALLARRAFATAEDTRALNELVHPRVRERLLERLAAAGSRPVVLDVPLLLESPLGDRVTDWVFVASDEADRDARAAARDWPPDERARRETRQADLAVKRARADHVLENRGSIEDLGEAVEALLTHLGLPHVPREPA